jgi:hypothetical protein
VTLPETDGPSQPQAPSPTTSPSVPVLTTMPSSTPQIPDETGTPSLAPQESETIGPSSLPTLSISPSLSPQVNETVAPTAEPSMSLSPSSEPPVLETETPSLVLSMSPSMTPTAVPSQSTSCEDIPRATALIDALLEVTDAEILISSETPQGKAGTWLLISDPASVDPCTYPTLLQRYALATLYFATEGDDWIDNTEWLLGEHECNWEKVSCDESLETTELMLGTSILDAHHFSAP